MPAARRSLAARIPAASRRCFLANLHERAGDGSAPCYRESRPLHFDDDAVGPLPLPPLDEQIEDGANGLEPRDPRDWKLIKSCVPTR